MNILNEKQIIKRGSTGTIPMYGKQKELLDNTSLGNKGLTDGQIARDFYAKQRSPLAIQNIISWILNKSTVIGSSVYGNGNWIYIYQPRVRMYQYDSFAWSMP